jgi:hypothetical protein
MNRRGFFKAFAALPLVGVAALAKSVKPPNEPDHVLEGVVLIKGALRVEGANTGTALIAGDLDAMSTDYKNVGFIVQGPER